MERLFYHPTVGPTPAPSHLAGAQDVTFRSSDGTLLRGWFIPAQSVADETPATIFHVHGNAGNLNDHLWFVEYLANKGFNLLLFDYRGYGESEGKARRRQRLLDDAHAALDALLSRPDVDPSRIGLYGQSLGGAIGLNLMAARPEIRAAVFESPFASWRDEAAEAIGGCPPGLLARGAAWLLIPDSHRPLDAAIQIHRPMLFVHGDADRIIDDSHSRRLYDAAAKAGNRSVRLIVYPGGEHNSLRDSHPELEGEVVGFFQSAFGADQ